MTGPLTPDGRPTVSVSVVLYNSADRVAETLRSLRDDVDSGFAEVVLVDNASPDAGVEVAREALPAAAVISQAENRGFAAGHNAARPRMRGRYWLLLNPDVVLPPGGLPKLAAWLDDRPRIGVASPDLRLADGRPGTPARAFPSASLGLLELTRAHRLLPASLRGRLLKGPYLHAPGDLEADWVPGAAMIVRREAVDACGALDDSFFMYGEDIEWCWRMRRGGWRVAVCQDVVATHREGSSARRSWNEEQILERIAGGVRQACERMYGPTRTRSFILATMVALALESCDPRRTAEWRSRSRRWLGAWAHTHRVGTR